MKLSLLYETLNTSLTKSSGDFWLCTWHYEDGSGKENKPLLFINNACGKFLFAYVSTKNHSWPGKIDIAPHQSNGLREQSYVYLSRLQLLGPGDVHRKIGTMVREDWEMCVEEFTRLKRSKLIKVIGSPS